MKTQTARPLVDEYLDRLHAAAQQLPVETRDELVGEIEIHLAETLGPDPTRAEARIALARLGSPEAIVAEALPPVPTRMVKRGVREWLTIVALLFGGVVIPVVGWAAGVVLLWSSSTWRGRDKVVGTLFFPGGFALAGALIAYGVLPGGTECGIQAPGAKGPRGQYSCHDLPANGFHGGVLKVLVFALILPLVGAAYLAWRARPHAVRDYPAGKTWVERRGPRETLAIGLLLVGGLLIPVVGWFVGVWMLWTSRAWSRIDKWVGTLLLPGGLAFPVIFLVMTNTDGYQSHQDHSTKVAGVTFEYSGSAWIAFGSLVLITAALVIPVITAVYLSRRARAHEVHSRFGR